MPVFQKGASGSPAGNHKGSRHKSTLLAEKILEDDRDGIINAVVAAAKNGDPTATRLCVERLERSVFLANMMHRGIPCTWTRRIATPTC
jgi:hypothetical protein